MEETLVRHYYGRGTPSPLTLHQTQQPALIGEQDGVRPPPPKSEGVEGFEGV